MRQRPQRQHLHAASQRLGDAGNEHDVCRPREQESPRPPVPIDSRLDCTEEVRHELNLVENHALSEAGDEAIGIGAGCAQHLRIVQRDVPYRVHGLRHLLRQRALADLPGSLQKDHRAVVERFE